MKFVRFKIGLFYLFIMVSCTVDEFIVLKRFISISISIYSKFLKNTVMFWHQNFLTRFSLFFLFKQFYNLWMVTATLLHHNWHFPWIILKIEFILSPPMMAINGVDLPHATVHSKFVSFWALCLLAPFQALYLCTILVSFES